MRLMSKAGTYTVVPEHLGSVAVELLVDITDILISTRCALGKFEDLSGLPWD